MTYALVSSPMSSQTPVFYNDPMLGVLLQYRQTVHIRKNCSFFSEWLWAGTPLPPRLVQLVRETEYSLHLP